MTGLTAAAATASYAPDDLAEFAGRIERVRGSMRQAGLDALVVADDDDTARKEGGNVRFLANVAAPSPYGNKLKLIVVLPLQGELTLVVPPSGFNSLTPMMRARTWIEQIVNSEPPTLLEKVSAMTSGKSPAEANAERVSGVLRESGLAQSRIGLCGSFLGAEELPTALPEARFEAAVVDDDAGTKRDPVELERARTKTPWEVARMERAQALVELGTRTFAASLVDGASFGEVLAEIEYRMKLAGAEEVFVPASRGSFPLGAYSLPGWFESSYRDGEMMAFEVNARVDGYWAQLPRTWVVGGQPTARQERLHAAALHGFEAMRDRLEVGVTGSELWDVGLAAVEAAGFEPWARYGHGMGITQTEWFSVLAGDKSRVQEGQSIIIHATAFDKTTGDEALVGEQYVLENGRPRLLSRTGSPVGLGLRPES